MKKDFLILGKSPSQRLDDTAIIAKAEYSVNFTKQGKKFCLCLQCNESNSYLFVHATKTYQFQTKVSEVLHILCDSEIFQKIVQLTI